VILKIIAGAAEPQGQSVRPASHKYADVLHIDEALTPLEGLAVKRKVA
jgi:hypothetical protein